MSLGIQVSISKMREWERFLESTDSESDAPFRPRMPLMANPRALGECIRKANALSLPTLRNLLTCSGMASQKGALRSRLLQWHCRICGSVPVLRHTRKMWARGKRFRMARSESAARERLGRAACDSEFANSLLESGSFHSETRRRPIQAGHNPVAVVQRFQDLLTF